MDVDEALTAIVTRLREDPDRYAMHGYHVYLRPIWEEHIAEREGLDLHANRSEVASHGLDVSGVFYAAAWELCRRGILRPGIKSNMEQVTEDGQGGNGYSYTPMGRRWLEAVEQYDYIPTEPSRLAEMLAPFGQRFGPGFHQRAQEAVGCYLGTMYLGLLRYVWWRRRVHSARPSGRQDGGRENGSPKIQGARRHAPGSENRP